MQPSRNPAGRPVGAIGKRTIELRERLEAHMLEKHNIQKYDPIITLADMAFDQALTFDLRIQCHKAILPYLHASLKAIEVTGKDGGAIEFKSSLVSELVSEIDAEDADFEVVSDGLDTKTAQLPAPPITPPDPLDESSATKSKKKK